MTDIVNAIFVNDDKVLLVKRSAHRKNYANTWSFPGGHVEVGETFEQALVREAGEEIDLRPTAFRKIDTIVDLTDSEIKYHMYMVTHWTGDEPKLVGDEHSELTWFSPDEAIGLSDLALSDYRRIFDQLQHPNSAGFRRSDETG